MSSTRTCTCRVCYTVFTLIPCSRFTMNFNRYNWCNSVIPSGDSSSTDSTVLSFLQKEHIFQPMSQDRPSLYTLLRPPYSRWSSKHVNLQSHTEISLDIGCIVFQRPQNKKSRPMKREQRTQFYVQTRVYFPSVYTLFLFPPIKGLSDTVELTPRNEKTLFHRASTSKACYCKLPGSI